MQARACCIPSAVYTSERARLSAAVSAAAAIVQAVRPFDLLRLVSRSGGQVSRCTVSGSGGGAPSQGGFVSVSSVLIPLSMPFFLLLSACSRVVRVKVVSQSRQSRKSREVKSRKSRKGRDTNVPTCAKVVKS